MSSSSNDTQILRASFLLDIPRAFMYPCRDVNERIESCQFYGPYAQTIWNFAQFYKLNLQLDDVYRIESSKILERMESGQYNLSVNGATYALGNRTIQYSYPLDCMQNCVMVPLEDELPKYYYVIWPFGRYIWTSIFVGAIYIAVLMRYIDYPAPVNRVTRSVVRNVLHSVAILLYCSNMNVRLRNATLRVLLFYSLLFLLGFMLSAYYFPYLTSYNMKPIFVKPITTVDDLLQAKIKVYIPIDKFEDLQATGSVDFNRLESVMLKVSLSNFLNMIDLIENIDHDYAYIVSQDQWTFINRQQRNLKKPKLHLSQICFGLVFKSFPLQANAKFAETLNTFIFAIRQAGLWTQWEEQAFGKAVSAGYAKIQLDSYPVEPLDLMWLSVAWIVLGSGLTISCLAMFVEYYARKRQNLNLQYDIFE